MMRWRKVEFLLKTSVLVIMLVAAFWSQSSASAQELLDANAAGMSLPVLIDGARVDGVLPGAVTARLYGFMGSAGDVVTITMTQTSDQLDPYLVLLGAGGELIASDDDSGTAVVLAAAINDVTLPADGAYVILATSLSHIIEVRAELPEPQTFTLTLDGNQPPADSESNSLPLSVFVLEPDETTTAALQPGQVAAYFILPAGTQSVIVDEADFDTVLHLFDNAGARLMVNDDDAERGMLASALYNLDVPAPGGLAIVSDVFFYLSTQDLADSELGTFEGGTLTVSISPG